MMKRKISRFFCSIVFILSYISANAQEHPVVVRMLNEGIALHKEGKFSEAIELYKKALKFDKNSSAVTYELAYAAFENNDYKTAAKYARKHLKNDSAALPDSYRILGKSYVELKKDKKASAVYQSALDKFPHNTDLKRSAAVNMLKLNNFKQAGEYIEQAILENPSEPANHTMFGNIANAQNYHLKSLLSLYFSLLLEPKGERAALGVKMIKEQLNMDASDTLHLKLKLRQHSDTAMFHLQIFMKVLNRYVQKHLTIENEYERFAQINAFLFDKIAEKYQYNSGFVWDYYISFFLQLKNAALIETMSYYILQSETEAKTFLDSHPQKRKALEAIIQDFLSE